MDGTGLLFEPLLEALPDWIKPRVVAYPPHQPLGYTELLTHVQAACPTMEDFVLLAESFSGPLALMLAASQPRGLRGVVLCASFINFPWSAPWRWLAALARPGRSRSAPRWPARRVLLGRDGNDRLHDLLAQAMATVSAEALAARARAIAAVDVSAQLRSYRLPLLYLRAREDRVVGSMSLRRIRKK